MSTSSPARAEHPGAGPSRLGRLWRQFASGFSFVLFGASGLLVGLFIVPVLWLLPPAWRRRAARGLIRTFMRGFWATMRGLGLFDCEVEGAGYLRESNILVIANHPTLIDAVLLIGAIPQVAVIAKGTLANHPVTGPAMRAAQYILNDDGPSMVEGSKAEFARQGRVLVFPESTRSTPGMPVTLQRGAANIAARTNCRLVMVTIRVTEPLLHKGTTWYQMPVRRPAFRVLVSAPQDLGATRGASANPARAARELTAGWQAMYAQRLAEMERFGRGSAGEGNR
jgi:1-acyl-sn-glycerol-3-phosphate acyltransferase